MPTDPFFNRWSKAFCIDPAGLPGYLRTGYAVYWSPERDEHAALTGRAIFLHGDFLTYTLSNEEASKHFDLDAFTGLGIGDPSQGVLNQRYGRALASSTIKPYLQEPHLDQVLDLIWKLRGEDEFDLRVQMVKKLRETGMLSNGYDYSRALGWAASYNMPVNPGEVKEDHV